MASETIQEYKKLVNEISNGMEQVKRLRGSSSSGNEASALEKMLTSYEEALSILNRMDPQGQHHSLKRRRITTRVRVQVGTGSGCLPDDGYSWRKYGKKDLLGSKYPRTYLRCTHRWSQGCLARKRVKRSDDDPSVFEIEYTSAHTCIGLETDAAIVAWRRGWQN